MISPPRFYIYIVMKLFCLLLRTPLCLIHESFFPKCSTAFFLTFIFLAPDDDKHEVTDQALRQFFGKWIVGAFRLKID